MANKRATTRWSRQAEALTLASRPRGVLQARRNFRALDREQRLELAREIVETRASELCLAYRNVVSVAFGYKVRRNNAGVSRVSRTACVIFVVKEKWQGDDEVNPLQTLPRELFAYVRIDGERRLCAVPTDVDPAEEYTDVRPESSTREMVNVKQESTRQNSVGTVTVAVRRSSEPEKIFALSCRHVFSLSGKSKATRATKNLVYVRSDPGKRVGLTTGVRGALRTKGTSFDAQLAEVTEVDSLGALLEGVRFDGPDAWAEGFRDIPEAYFLLVAGHSSNRPREQATAIRMRKSRVFQNFPIDYRGRIRGKVTHQWVVKSVRTSGGLGPFPGDSGAPMVSRRNGGMLLGMHFAGNSTGDVSYMLPAWELLNPYNYGVQGEAMWELAQSVDGTAPALADLTTRATVTPGRMSFQGLRPRGRAKRFCEELIRPTLKRIGKHSDEAERLLLGTAIQESHLKHRRQLGGGPARGLFQMEPATHDEIWENFLSTRRRSELADAIRMMKTDPDADGAEELENNDVYACAMARAHYLRVPTAIPTAGGVRAHARYWKQHYNTASGAGTITQYIENWRQFAG